MQKPNPRLSLLLVALSAAIPSTSTAEGRFTAAVGLGYGSELYEGGNSDIAAVPYLAYDTELYHIGLDGLFYKIVRGESFQVNVGFAPRWEPNFPVGTLFSGLDRDTTVEGTLSGTYQFTDDLQTSMNLRHDLLSEHGGYELDFALSRSDHIGIMNLDLSVGARHRDADLNAYLVGVSAGEATGARRSYSPGSTTSYFVGANANVPVGSNMVVIGTLGLEYFGDAYTDSPLVKDGHTVSMSVGVAYAF